MIHLNSTFSSANQAPIMLTIPPARPSEGSEGTRGCRISMALLPTGITQLSIEFPASLQKVAPLQYQQSAMGVVAGEPGCNGAVPDGSHRDPNALNASPVDPSTVLLSGRGESCPEAGGNDGQVKESMVQQTRSINLRCKQCFRTTSEESSESSGDDNWKAPKNGTPQRPNEPLGSDSERE
ncbi:hypothetical protein PCA20602_04881 [Pandoraea capi]|uniref:Uncharacterized protein n=1 Tax=Pandoraea capi TaxID=2508286 RepID=A0ABY6WBU7_9BURK|nr:hypothetical protein [Pandoraea capi]VVE53610.1 hypothetical protein PCA20602_04881 [Pandoraea capi]